MKINFEAVIKNLDDVKMKDEKGEALTLKKVAVNSLLADASPGAMGVRGLSPVEKMENYEIAKRIHTGTAKGLGVEDSKKVLDAIIRNYPPLICGRCREILDEEKDKEKDKEKEGDKK